MKKKKKNINSQNLLVQLKKYLTMVGHVLNKHSVVVIFIVAGATIGYSLVRSQGYLNPLRDETRYTEASGKNVYNKIDYALVTKLQKSLNDIDIQVRQSLSPDRKNPFSE